VVMGDERIVPLAHKDSNWGQVSPYLDALGISDENRLVPLVEGGAEGAAADYDQLLQQLPQLDVVWLGVGEDGHTLSLFPGRDSHSNSLAMPVHNSPKPPADRMSLTLAALQKAKTCFILAAGEGKAPVITRALHGDMALPVAQAAQTIMQNGGTVTWLLDTGARGTLLPT
jgi:6-phosphogluconolactonase